MKKKIVQIASIKYSVHMLWKTYDKVSTQIKFESYSYIHVSHNYWGS